MSDEFRMTNNQDNWMSRALKLEAENKRLRAVIIRAKDALLDGQSTQWVHDLLVAAILKKDAWGDTLGPNDFETGAEGEGK